MVDSKVSKKACERAAMTAEKMVAWMAANLAVLMDVKADWWE
jgi:hypothetical protein